jgi:hypothetical protein
MSGNSEIRRPWIVVVLVLLGAILNPSFVAGQNAFSGTSSQQLAVPAQSAMNLSLDKLRLKRSEAEAYADFLDAHLVWIRSSSILNLTDLNNSLEVLQVLIDPASWRLTVSDALDSFRAHSGLWVLGLLISAVLLLGRRWARRELSRTAEKVNRPRKDRLSLTLWALARPA